MNLYPLLRPLLLALDAERAHRLTVWALKRMPARAPAPDHPILATKVFGLDFANPVGIAAGFDKHAEAPLALAALGFGFVELGSVTPRAQPGNPRPRVFRLAEDRAVINRYGFNSVGAARFRANLAAALGGANSPPVPIGINLGKNKETPADQAAGDYAQGVAECGIALGHYLVVNVSSPNTPGLRALQSRDDLLAISAGTRAAMAAAPGGAKKAMPLLLKIAPDLAEDDLVDIAAVVRAGHFDGVIVSNTTIRRPETLRGVRRGEAGGLSGAPLKPFALETLRAIYRLTGGSVPLIGVGGIASGADAYERIRAGASLVQLYTAMVYEGPGLAGRIKRELAALLRRDGWSALKDAVGVDHR